MRFASLTRDLEALEVVRRQHPILDWQDFDAVLIHSACNVVQNEVAVLEWNMNEQPESSLHKSLLDHPDRPMRLTKKVSFDEEINLDPSRPASLFASTVSPIVPFQKRPEAGGPDQDAFKDLEIVCCFHSVPLDHSTGDICTSLGPSSPCPISRSGSEESIADTRPSTPELLSFDTAIKIREESATTLLCGPIA